MRKKVVGKRSRLGEETTAVDENDLSERLLCEPVPQPRTPKYVTSDTE